MTATTGGAWFDLASGDRVGAAAGEIVALCGANGSGLDVVLREVAARIAGSGSGSRSQSGSGSPSPAERRLALIGSRRGLSPTFDIAENVFLGSELKKRLGPLPLGIDWKRTREQTEAILRSLGSELTARMPARELGEYDRLVVELARAIARDAAAIVLDEPGARLGEADAGRFFRVLRAVAERGIAVLVLTQKPRQALGYADRLVVVRDGAVVAEHPREEWGEGAGAGVAAAERVRERVLRELVDRGAERPRGDDARADGRGGDGGGRGQALGDAGAAAENGARAGVRDDGGGRGGDGLSGGARGEAPDGGDGRDGRGGPREELLRIVDWSTHDPLDPDRLLVDGVDLVVGAGEIVGVTGLRGSGAQALLLSVYGNSEGTKPSGTVSVRGTAVTTDTVEHAIAAGLYFASTDAPRYRVRFVGGIAMPVAASALPRLAKAGLIDRDSDLGPGDGWGGRLLGAVRSLSREGSANEQIRGLVRAFPDSERQVLLLGDPTAGASPAERAEVHAGVRAIARAGKGVVIASDDLDELLDLCDRVVGMSAGRVTGEVPGGADPATLAAIIVRN